jgi:hypothetical protein
MSRPASRGDVPGIVSALHLDGDELHEARDIAEFFATLDR